MCGDLSGLALGCVGASSLALFESGPLGTATVLETLGDAGEEAIIVGAAGADVGDDPGMIFFFLGSDGLGIGAGRPGGSSGVVDLRSYQQPFL